MRFKKGIKGIESGRSGKVIPSIIISVVVLFLAAAVLFSGTESPYTPVTGKCISCHNDTGYPADTDGDSVAAPYERPHNGTVMCEYCHGLDPHNLTYILPNGSYGDRSLSTGCPDCHIFTALKENNINFTSAPIIPALAHSSNPANGTIWGNYWNSSLNSSSSCNYCHGETKHNTTALGFINYLMLDENNTLNGSLGNTTWCADCHLNGTNPNYRGNLWSPPPPLITFDNTGRTRWINHTTFLTAGYRDSFCRPCHTANGMYAATSLNYSHDLGVGVNGGPACILCHFNGSGYHNIDIEAANMSVHSGMNAENATYAGVNAPNGACWACHDTDGNISNNPESLVMGDIYNTPKTCADCHLPNGTYYTQSAGWGGPTVSEHYFAGIGIKAGNSTSDISSCINCHENVSEMTIPNNDTDYGSFIGDGVRLTGGNMSFYHYGRPRPDIRTWGSGTTANCSYCHQNTTTSFAAAMTNAGYNSSILNHSISTASPDCFNSTCHGSGWLHNSTLGRPALTLPNSTFCLNCHSPKQEHNGSVNCTDCHIDTGSLDTIHPIKYVVNSGNFSASKSSAVNCTGCHMTQMANFTDAPVIPDFAHSNTPSAGIKWGTYWNNTSMTTACYYCHSKDVHNASLLGNVSLIKGSNIFNDPDLANSTWCIACHYNDNTSNYKGNLIDPEPPDILNTSGNVPSNASDGTPFYNHSDIENFNDSHCKNCHGSLLPDYNESSFNFSHRVSQGGGGPACISCHNKSAAGAPLNLRIDGSAIKKGVHRNLNSNASDSMSSDPINKACWACHGEGTEPDRHPARYKSPRTCGNSDCHSLSQSAYYENMVYSHFRNASLNGNPENTTNYNVTTKVECQECHINSVIIVDNTSLASVSHYGSKDKLVDSFNCRYCHIDKDNSDMWGGATLMNRNRTGLIELERERNKFSVSDGESIYLGEGYFLKLVEVTNTRDEALIQLAYGNRTVDETSLPAGRLYKYETGLVIDNSSVKTPVIMINITSIFKGGRSFIQFEGFRIKKVHSERESRNNTNCFACHLIRYKNEKTRYVAIDRESKQNSSDVIYYTDLFVDFMPENKSKIYYADENNVLDQLRSGEKYISYPDLQYLLKEGETWRIADKYTLKLNEVTTESKLAWLTLTINGAVAEDKVVTAGDRFNYTPGLVYKDTKTNVTVFTARVSSISQGTPNFVIISDVYAISPAVLNIGANSTISGYNTSWFYPGDTITTGRIPVDLHTPNLLADPGGWGDCVKCHDASLNLGIASIDAISTQLGKHSGLNRNASSKTILTDKIDRACWACHSKGEEPVAHPPANIEPRVCTSCHTYREEPYYDARYVGDETHGLEKDCETCHYMGSHNVVRFQVTPGIKAVTLSPEKPCKGDIVNLFAEAHSGHQMTIKNAEYFIDNVELSGNGAQFEPVDGVFDSQREEITARINTTGIAAGGHVIYIHAMERDNRWGAYYPVNLTIAETYFCSDILQEVRKSPLSEWAGIIYIILALFVVFLATYRKRIKWNFKFRR